MATPSDASASAPALAPAEDHHDLLPQLVRHLDRHMVFPMLEFVTGQLEDEDGKIPESARDKEREILRAKFELFRTTNMVDFVANLYCDLEGLDEPPAEYAERHQAVVARIERFEQDTSKITGLLQRDDVVSNLRSDKVANLDFLKKEHEVTSDMVDELYDFATFQYGCGNYGAAAELLYQFRVLSTDNDKVMAATWGRLASEILSISWESAMEELAKVREMVDGKLAHQPVDQLRHRTWLMHWALFPLFNYPQGRDHVLELYLHPGYLNTMQTSCPWMLRYLAAAVVITARGRRNAGAHQKQLKDVVRVVRQEAYEYADPVTRFLYALCIDFDFEEAQRQLVRAERVLRDDFFLLGHADDFVDAARHLIFESYCKIHARIALADLSARLGLGHDAAEKWIVDLIRDTRLDAKIDYQDGTVVMNHPPMSVYQQVIERTKGGFFRTQVLNAAVAR